MLTELVVSEEYVCLWVATIVDFTDRHLLAKSWSVLLIEHATIALKHHGSLSILSDLVGFLIIALYKLEGFRSWAWQSFASSFTVVHTLSFELLADDGDGLSDSCFFCRFGGGGGGIGGFGGCGWGSRGEVGLLLGCATSGGFALPPTRVSLDFGGSTFGIFPSSASCLRILERDTR